MREFNPSSGYQRLRNRRLRDVAGVRPADTVPTQSKFGKPSWLAGRRTPHCTDSAQALQDATRHRSTTGGTSQLLNCKKLEHHHRFLQIGPTLGPTFGPTGPKRGTQRGTKTWDPTWDQNAPLVPPASHSGNSIWTHGDPRKVESPELNENPFIGVHGS